MYNSFAQIYDKFMGETPYKEWADFIERKFSECAIQKPELVVDLGCGTGVLTALMAERGYEMIAVDASADMLMQAREKFAELPETVKQPLLLLQDAREMEFYGTVDAFVSSCDVLNYVLEEKELYRVFRLVENYLNPGGLFIFDMNTLYKHAEVLGDRTFADTDNDAAIIWTNYQYPENEIHEYKVCCFERTENGMYERSEELHYQRAYGIGTVKKLLEKAGLEFIAAYADYKEKEPDATTERVVFVAREHLYAELGEKRSLEEIDNE